MKPYEQIFKPQIQRPGALHPGRAAQGDERGQAQHQREPLPPLSEGQGLRPRPHPGAEPLPGAAVQRPQEQDRRDARGGYGEHHPGQRLGRAVKLRLHGLLRQRHPRRLPQHHLRLLPGVRGGESGALRGDPPAPGLFHRAGGLLRLRQDDLPGKPQRPHRHVPVRRRDRGDPQAQPGQCGGGG